MLLKLNEALLYLQMSILATGLFLRLAQTSTESSGAVANLIQRWSHNISTEVINRILTSALVFVIGSALHFKENTQNSTVIFALYILLLDLVFYARHRFYHRYFWRFHRFHHEDEGFDVTLSLRIHPIEVVIHVFFFYFINTVLNLSVDWMLLASQIFGLQAIISHLEVQPRFPKLWRILGRIFVLPTSHRFHHSKERPDVNFGFLFSFWDRLFKTHYEGQNRTFPVGTPTAQKDFISSLWGAELPSPLKIFNFKNYQGAKND